VAGWSITRIADGIGDYQVAWMSIVGALGWAAVIATFGARTIARLGSVNGRLVVNALSAVTVAILCVTVVGALFDARRYAIEQRDMEFRRKVVAIEVGQLITREGVQRPMLHMSQSMWLDAACVVLEVYKHHRQMAVDEERIGMFGSALSANGREDLDVFIADTAQHEVLERSGNNAVVAREGIFVHTAPRRFGTPP
jgi:hypothetical protein